MERINGETAASIGNPDRVREIEQVAAVVTVYAERQVEAAAAREGCSALPSGAARETDAGLT